EVARIRRIDQRIDRIDDEALRADRLDVIRELVDDGHDVGRTLHEVEVTLTGIENRELTALDRLFDRKPDRLCLSDDILGFLVGDENARFLMLEAAREEL